MSENNPHNNLFIWTFSIRSEVKVFVKNYLPKWISEELDYRTFKQSTTSYMNEELKEYFSDIVYSCRSKTGKLIQLSFLFEHKSFVPKNIYIQLNRYTTEAYQQQSLEKERKQLTVVLPVIIYHGKSKWHQRAFYEHFSIPNDHFKKYIPTYEYELIDLSKIADDWIIKIKSGHFLKSTLLVFKHKEDKDFLYQFQEEIFIFVEQELDVEQKRLFLKAILTYIFTAFKFEKEEIEDYLKNLKTGDMVNFIKGSYADHLFTEGMEKGLEKGLEKGMEKRKKMELLFHPVKTLLATYSLFPRLNHEDAGKLAKTKKEKVENFYKALTTKKKATIKKKAISLFFDKQNLEDKYLKEVEVLIEDFLKKKT